MRGFRLSQPFSKVGSRVQRDEWYVLGLCSRPVLKYYSGSAGNKWSKGVPHSMKRTPRKAILFAGIVGIAVFGNAAPARATAPNVKYWCNGTFASPAVSGNDLFGLAGEPF